LAVRVACAVGNRDEVLVALDDARIPAPIAKQRPVGRGQGVLDVSGFSFMLEYKCDFAVARGDEVPKLLLGCHDGFGTTADVGGTGKMRPILAVRDDYRQCLPGVL
jgi:hypothetical protein